MGVPGVGHVPGMRREIQQEVDFSTGVRPEQTAHIRPVGLVHADQIVVAFVVLPPGQHRDLAGCGDAGPGQFFPGAPMGRTADGVPVQRGTGGFHLVRKAPAPDHVAKNKLRHGGAADVAVAQKQDSYHLFITPCKFYFSS